MYWNFPVVWSVCSCVIGHVYNIPTMQFSTGISRDTQSKSYMLSLAEYVWEIRINALWDTNQPALLCERLMFEFVWQLLSVKFTSIFFNDLTWERLGIVRTFFFMLWIEIGLLTTLYETFTKLKICELYYVNLFSTASYILQTVQCCICINYSI